MPTVLVICQGGTKRVLFLCLVATLLLMGGGCAHVEGNYPPLRPDRFQVAAKLAGNGFRLLAGSRLRLDRVEAELEQLKSQGFSRRDPQILQSVARRRHVPVALLADRTGHSYYRFTVQLDPGTLLTLAPGALEVTVTSRGRTIVVHDRGFLREDRRHPGGCRPPARAALTLGSPGGKSQVTECFLVRLPVQGDIVALALAPERAQVRSSLPSP